MSSRRTSRPPARSRILDAALALIVKSGAADVTMAEIAKAARISRQALYLHFSDRATLLLALVEYVDQRRGLDAAIQRLVAAPDGTAAIREVVALQARMNPGVWGVARAVDAVRRRDKAAQRSWQDRHAHRLKGARMIVARLLREGTLNPQFDGDTAADLLWNLTSLRTWEDLVLERGWSAQKYQKHLNALLMGALVRR